MLNKLLGHQDLSILTTPPSQIHLTRCLHLHRSHHDSPHPIPRFPNSPKYTPFDEIPPASISSPLLSPIPPPGTTYHTLQSPSFYTAHVTFTNKIFENFPVKRLHQPGIVRNLDKLYGSNVTSSVAIGPITNLSDHSVSQNPPVLTQATTATNQAGPSRLAAPNAPNSSSSRQRIEGDKPSNTCTSDINRLTPKVH